MSLKTVFAQETAEDLEKRIEQLTSKEKLLETQLAGLRDELSVARRELQRLQTGTLQESGGIQVTAFGATPMFEEPTVVSDRIAEIQKGEIIIVLRAVSRSHFEVVYGDLRGFVSRGRLNRDPNTAKILEALDADLVEQTEIAEQEEKRARQAAAKAKSKAATAAAEAARVQRRKEMLQKWGQQQGTFIADGNVRIGMTAEMARDSWGRPDDINRTTTAFSVSEQWVYGNGNFLYFTDGVLTSIQN